MKQPDRLSLPNPGLYPREKPRHTDSHAEIEVYNSLKDQLPVGWYAWHSLSVHKEDTGGFGENDFVIAVPEYETYRTERYIEDQKTGNYNSQAHAVEKTTIRRKYKTRRRGSARQKCYTESGRRVACPIFFN